MRDVRTALMDKDDVVTTVTEMVTAAKAVIENLPPSEVAEDLRDREVLLVATISMTA